MEKLFKYVGWVAALVTIIAGCIAIYFALHEKRIKLDVEIINSENLIAHEAIQDLSIKYYYKDTVEIHNLWKIQWVIRNTGDKTIVGIGSEKHILSDGLSIHFNNKSHTGCRVLFARISNSNNGATINNQKLYFKQWRRDEYIELTAFIESPTQPELFINDRDIVDSEISYSVYTPKREYNCIADHLPIWLNKTFKIIYFIIGAIVLLAGIFGISSSNKDKSSMIAALLIFILLLLPIIWIL